MKQFILVVCAVSFLSFSAQSQDSTHTYKEWINAGIGFSSPFEKTRGIKFSFVLSYNFGWDNIYYQVGINGVKQPNVERYLDYDISSISFLPGLRTMNRWLHGSVFLGPAPTSTNKSNTTTIVWTVGLVLNLQGFLKLAEDVGLGIDVYGNLNTTQSVAALRFALHISNAN